MGWEFRGRENYVISLQEHGIVHLSDELFGRVKIGDLIGIMPVHSCLAVDTLGICWILMETGTKLLGHAELDPHQHDWYGHKNQDKH